MSVLIGNQPTTTAATESLIDVSNSSSSSSAVTTHESTSTSTSTTVTYADILSLLIPQNWRPKVMKQSSGQI